MKKLLFTLCCLSLLTLFGCSSPTNPKDVIPNNSENTQPEENVKPSEIEIVEVPSMPFAKLQSYKFDINKKYIVHINNDCMLNGAGESNTLTQLLKTNSNIVELIIDNDVTSISENVFRDCNNITLINYNGTRKQWTALLGLGNAGIPSSCKVICSDDIIEVPSMSFDKLKVYTFNPSRRYRIHLNQDCMNNGDAYNNQLNQLIASNECITEVIIDNDVSTIGKSIFRSCHSLTSIIIPKSVTTICDSAFENCGGLTSITIPSGVTFIGKNAFGECFGLKSITISNGLKSIDYRAFHGCTGLTSITLPDSLTSIGIEAFFNCTRLISINIPKQVESVGIATFNSCYNLTSINASEENNNFLSVDGVLYNKDKTSILCYPAGKTHTEFDIPNGVKTIGANAFFLCSDLEKINIPEGVTSIEQCAFYSCLQLASVNIPEGVTVIGVNAFSDCRAIKSIIIPEGLSVIDGNVFSNCQSLETITIPTSVVKFNYYAFDRCNRLDNIKYLGTIEQWKDIQDKDKANINKGCIVTCTNGKITI